jgi:hypothetical protein
MTGFDGYLLDWEAPGIAAGRPSSDALVPTIKSRSRSVLSINLSYRTSSFASESGIFPIELNSIVNLRALLSKSSFSRPEMSNLIEISFIRVCIVGRSTPQGNQFLRDCYSSPPVFVHMSNSIRNSIVQTGSNALSSSGS